MVDLWSLGILIYELKHGCTPFFGKGKGDDDQVIKQRILNLEYTFRSDCSAELKDLVSKLLVKDPTKRLGLIAAR
jgi:serine/threonine protein kinase